MSRSTAHLRSASLLLTVMLFSVLPRTFFHHCEEGRWSAVDHTVASVVHTDTHCPICEAPLPVCDGVADLSFHMEEALLWIRMSAPALVPVHMVRTTPRLRGPPRLR